jgi:glutamyl-tRNA reductase
MKAKILGQVGKPQKLLGRTVGRAQGFIPLETSIIGDSKRGATVHITMPKTVKPKAAVTLLIDPQDIKDLNNLINGTAKQRKAAAAKLNAWTVLKDSEAKKFHDRPLAERLAAFIPPGRRAELAKRLREHGKGSR